MPDRIDQHGQQHPVTRWLVLDETYKVSASRQVVVSVWPRER
jgi:hypothetical protein